MIKTLYDKFKPWSDKGSIYIISDLHFNDEDTKIMAPDWIDPIDQVKIINKLVHKNDTLICLGDVGDVSYVSMLNGYKVLIMGNHDYGASKYKREIKHYTYDKKDYTLESIKEIAKSWKGRKTSISEGYNLTHSPFEYWDLKVDNNLFDEVYEGPLFISDKILLSHEPVYGLDWCLNIHGHDHNGVEPYKEGCKHINLAANVCNYTPVSLGKLIKDGVLSDINSIHRNTIDRASERKKLKEE